MELAHIEVSSEAALWDWLGAHHAQEASVWLVTWKAEMRDKYVGREAVLDALLAHGWIDGRRKVHPSDPARTMQLIAPRQQQAWSKSYKDRVERLRTAGRMHPAGEAAVAAGQASGLWSLFDDVDALIVPADLASALANTGGTPFYEAAAPSYRRNLLRWVKLAKTDATRAKRIAEIARDCAAGRKIAQM